MSNENFEQRVSDEYRGKAVCHTYPSLVSELADRMVVDEKVLLTNKKDKFDPEDIFSWIKAVDYKDTQNAPDVQAILSTKQGAETIIFDARKEETLKNKDERVSKESLLYTMAMTEAKMKMISNIAEEVYPAVAFQIKDYRKEMEKMREEILENKEEKRSLEDVLRVMTGNRVVPLATAGIITMIVLSSCGANPGTTETVTPGEDTSQPVATETSPAATEVPAETPFVEVTQGVENEQAEELMKQVDLFLKAEGPYTEDEIDEMMFRTRDTQGKLELGIINASEKDAVIDAQGVFLGIIESEDGIIMLMGEEDQNGSRFVTPLKLYDQMYDIHKDAGSAFGYLIGDKKFNFGPEGETALNTKAEVVGFLKNKIGIIMAYQLTLIEIPALDDATKKYMIEVGYTNPEITYQQLYDLRDNVKDLNKNLAVSLWHPSPSNYGDITIADTMDKFGPSTENPVKIYSAEDIQKAVATEWLPMPEVLRAQK